MVWPWKPIRSGSNLFVISLTTLAWKIVIAFSSFLIKQDIEPSLAVELIQQWVLDSVTTLIKIHDEIPHEDYFNDYVCRELMNEMEHWVLPEKLTNELFHH